MGTRILAACIAFSCAPTQSIQRGPECLTTCGLRAPGNCGELQALEDRAVKVFGGLDWGGPEVVCEALRGWTLTLHARRPSDGVACGADAWLLAAGFCVRGYTHIEARTIELVDRAWSRGALAHELVHVIDLTTRGRAGHCGWGTRGIMGALHEIQGRPDDSASDMECL